MSIGIKLVYSKTADSVFNLNAVQAAIGLDSPVAANERQLIRYFVPITVGASGGVRWQIVVPAGGTLFIAIMQLNNGNNSAQNTYVQLTSAVITNALASAGNHWFWMDATVQNGVNAGTISLQMAQSTADANSLTVRDGGKAEVFIV